MADTLTRKKNITKKEIMIALPEGVGITVRPREYVAGEYFKNLPSDSFASISFEESENLKCAYTYTYVPTKEGNPIKIVSTIDRVKDSEKEQIIPGQVFYETGVLKSETGVPSEIYVTFDIGNTDVYIEMSELEQDDTYEEGHKLYFTYKNPNIKLSTIDCWKAGAGPGMDPPEQCSSNIISRGIDKKGVFIIVTSIASVNGSYYFTATTDSSEVAFIKYAAADYMAYARYSTDKPV